jgi:YidC/Oxa1 family membrane protein insertase
LIQFTGLSKVLNTSKPLSLEWNLKTYTKEEYYYAENRYSEHKMSGGKQGLGTDGDIVNDVSYIA